MLPTDVRPVVQRTQPVITRFELEPTAGAAPLVDTACESSRIEVHHHRRTLAVAPVERIGDAGIVNRVWSPIGLDYGPCGPPECSQYRFSAFTRMNIASLHREFRFWRSSGCGFGGPADRKQQSDS